MVPRYNALYLSVNVFSTKVLIGDTIFPRHQPVKGPPFYVVIPTTGKGPSFLSYFKTLSLGPALWSSSLPTELILQLLER